ncbi:AI-2E family transporter [Sporanaerobium hydrogeniformans]|uniref:AI-2E family transporter n=1 Tax=Sporanaerobium hydrogeniformans TaxID=3072179 RepID=A0AC61DDQ5_9FIRM|nr:AI-2E family transporter [Sporanaerobium hydrogeniformans]PHV70836.1 AI-2E family transporter [Sporanaerobium hydrogeniformans]
MKKFWHNNTYLKIALYAIFVVVVSILFYRVSSNTDNIAPAIMNFFKGIFNTLSPIFYGLLIAYLFNPIMDFFERYLLKLFKPQKIKYRKFIRTLSIVIVYIVILGTCVLMIRYLVPQILQNIKELFDMLPIYMHAFQKTLASLEGNINEAITAFSLPIDTPKLFEMINANLQDFLNFSKLNVMVSALFSTIVTRAYTFTFSLFNGIMALVIAFYTLQQKEAFTYGAKRVIYSFFSVPTADKIITISSEGHQTFIRFFIGKFIDSTIIGILAFIGLTILKNPYAILLAFIVGVFNMIPYFGPLLGAIPAVIITLFSGLWPATLVGLFIFLLQQFDGLILGPKILGDSIGLSPFWIVSGILVGGALWGVLGMFFASPIIAILLVNINRHMDKVLHTKHVAVPPTLLAEPTGSSKEEIKSRKTKK